MRGVVTLDPLILADGDELQREVADLVELVARQNAYLMRRLGPRRIPPLYQSGVLYRLDPWNDAVAAQLSLQHFPNCLEVLHRRFADCKGLVPYKLAELRVREPQKHFSVRTYLRKASDGLDGVRLPGRTRIGAARAPAGDVLVHLQIQHPNGDVEDPSRLLHQ